MIELGSAGQSREARVRFGVAIAFVVGIPTFFIWFIATHLTRYGF